MKPVPALLIDFECNDSVIKRKKQGWDYWCLALRLEIVSSYGRPSCFSILRRFDRFWKLVIEADSHLPWTLYNACFSTVKDSIYYPIHFSESYHNLHQNYTSQRIWVSPAISDEMREAHFWKHHSLPARISPLNVHVLWRAYDVYEDCSQATAWRNGLSLSPQSSIRPDSSTSGSLPRNVHLDLSMVAWVLALRLGLLSPPKPARMVVHPKDVPLGSYHLHSPVWQFLYGAAGDTI